MKQRANAESKLRHLASGGALAGSQCGSGFLSLVRPLMESGVLEWKRSGAGRALMVDDQPAFDAWVRQRFPMAALPAHADSRLAGVALFRDSKSIPNNVSEIVSLRVRREEALLREGIPAGAAAATRAHGVFSLMLRPKSPYELRGCCALVENPALFGAAEALALHVDAFLYGHGRISSRVLNWLAGMPHPDFKILHLPDYDPAGLAEYLRLRSRLGSRVTLHIPADLEQRFARFSNPALMHKPNTQALHAQLRQSELPEVREVVSLIDHYNAGLEQEALLISLTSV